MTGEMTRDELTPEAWPMHFAIANALGGTVEPFDQYQGPYICIGADIRGGVGVYATAPRGLGVVRLWLCSDDGGNGYIFNEANGKQSKRFWLHWKDPAEGERLAVEAARSVTEKAGLTKVANPNPRYVVDGHEFEYEDSAWAGDGEFPPFAIFDTERQCNLFPFYPTREAAERALLHLAAPKDPRDDLQKERDALKAANADLLRTLQIAWHMMPQLKPRHPDYFNRERVRAAIAKATAGESQPVTGEAV